MKKLFVIMALSVFAVACGGSNESTEAKDTTTVIVDTTPAAIDTTVVVDTTAVADTTKK